MIRSYKNQRRLLEVASQSKSPEAIANLMDRSPEQAAVHPDRTAKKAVRASASAGGKQGGLDRMMNGMKQALLVIGSTMALIVVVPVFLILGLGFFNIAREIELGWALST